MCLFLINPLYYLFTDIPAIFWILQNYQVVLQRLCFCASFGFICSIVILFTFLLFLIFFLYSRNKLFCSLLSLTLQVSLHCIAKILSLMRVRHYQLSTASLHVLIAVSDESQVFLQPQPFDSFKIYNLMCDSLDIKPE